MTALELLPVTPIPHPDETYDGYIVRLTSMNGYPSYHDLEQDLKKTYSKKTIRPSPHDIYALSKHDVRQLAGAPGKASYTINGRPNSNHLFNRAAICPDCIATVKYQQAKFCHPLIAACLTHKRILITQCECRRPISYNRKHLGSCECGRPYRQKDTPDISPAAWEMIRMSHLALGLVELSCLQKDQPLPYNLLLPLTHEQLYYFINQIGRLFIKLERFRPSSDGKIKILLILRRNGSAL